MSGPRALAETLARLPPLRPLIAQAYRRYFDRAQGNIRLFRGIYPDFASALRAAPADRLIGFDNDSSIARVGEDRRSVSASDYPVLFWLSSLLGDCRMLFDWGGNVGLKYFAYRRYLSYPPTFTWLVSDLPAVAARGRELAAHEHADGLRFTSNLSEIGDADVLLAAGSLHFIEDPFGLLRAAGRLPRHALLSKVPAYRMASAVTLQNAGTAIRLNHLFNQAEFVGNFERLGYRLIDEWSSPDSACDIPFFSEHSISAYSGFYFARVDAP